MREKLITPSVNGLFKKCKIMKNGQNMQWEINKANRWQIKNRKSKKEFNFHAYMHRNNYSNIYPTRCNFTQFILSGNCSTCFRLYLNPFSGAQTTVSTASGISHTVTVICRYRGRVGTGLSVLWVAYATHSTLKPVPTLPR